MQAAKGAQAMSVVAAPLTPRRADNGRHGIQPGCWTKLLASILHSRADGLALTASNTPTRWVAPLQAGGDETDGAKSSATLVITEGNGQAMGNASTESLVTVENAIAEAITDAVAEAKDGGSVDALAKYTAKTIGNAIVEISR